MGNMGLSEFIFPIELFGAPPNAVVKVPEYTAPILLSSPSSFAKLKSVSQLVGSLSSQTFTEITPS